MNLLSPSTQLMHILQRKSVLKIVRRNRNAFELPVELIRYDDKRNMSDRIAEEVNFWHDDRDKRSECDDLKRDLRLVGEYFDSCNDSHGDITNIMVTNVR